MKKVDAILVLGAGIQEKKFRKRVKKAVFLYKKGIATKVIFSGKRWGGSKTRARTTEARAMARIAVRLGIPRRDILIEERSLNTLGNFYFTRKQILEPLRLRRLVVVTHKRHFPKAKYIARKVLGKTFSYAFIPSDRRQSEVEREHNSLARFKKIFPQVVDIKAGDMNALGKFLKSLSFYKYYKKI